MVNYVLPIVLFLFMGGLAMQWPVTQHLIVEMACHRLDYPEDVCSDLSKHPEAEDAVQARASTIMVLQSVFCDLPGAVASLILGAQSDKIGRKRVMMMPVIGVTLLNAILLVSSVTHTASLVALLSSSVALGISGGIGTFLSTVTNYITDKTPEEQRTEVLSKTMPFMGLGVIVGLILSGVLTQHLGVPAVYFIDLCILLIVVYLIVFHLEESRATVKADGSSADASQPSGVIATVWENLTAGIKVFTSEKRGFVRLQLAALVLSGMISMAAMVAEGNLLMLYTKKSPFSWSPSTYGLFTAGKNALGIVGQVVGTAIFFKVVGEKSVTNDFLLLLMGSLTAVVTNLTVASATSTTMLMMTMFFVMFATPAQSANGSITSKLVDPLHKGAFMSLGTFLNTLAVPAVGFILNNIYSSTVQTSPGFVFVCMASMHAVVLAAITYVVMFKMEGGAKEEKTE